MELVQLIGNLGFPIAVAAYLLVRFEKKIELLTISIDKLTNFIDRIQ